MKSRWGELIMLVLLLCPLGMGLSSPGAEELYAFVVPHFEMKFPLRSNFWMRWLALSVT